MKRLLFSLLLISITAFLAAQSVGIGTTSPDSSALLELSGTTKGLLIPRMTTAQRDSIANPAIGLQILNLDDMCIDIYDGVYWSKHCGTRITGYDTIPSTWKWSADFPGGRSYAVAFSIGSKGYMGTGKTGSQATLDFWEFDTLAGTWIQKANIGSQVRAEACGFAINGKGYIGLGYDGDNTELPDLYEYDPASNTWSQKAFLPVAGRRMAAVFTIGSEAYISGGFINGFPNDIIVSEVWKYTPMSNSWTQENSLPWFLAGAVGFTIDNKGFVTTGFTRSIFSSNLFPTDVCYQYLDGTWTTMSPFGGGVRYSATGFSLNSRGYVGTGQTDALELHKDFWEYDPASNSWQQTGDFGGSPRGGAVSFTIGNKAYVGTGFDGTAQGFDFWEFDQYPMGPQYENGIPLENAAMMNDGIWTQAIDNIYLSDPAQVGIGTSEPANLLDISSTSRTGTHPGNLPLYVTGNMSGASNGVEIRHSSGTQGIGIGYNTIYATGSNSSQDLGFSARGNGRLLFITAGGERMRINEQGHVGIGVPEPYNFLDIQAGQFRSNSHPENLPLYVTGEMGSDTNGVEFRHYNATQGIGFGFNTIYAAGSSANQDLGLKAKGPEGSLLFTAHRLDIRAGADRTGTHPTSRPLYITGNLSASSNGVEIRHFNGAEGIGIGYNGLYAAGENESQWLGMVAKGPAGGLYFITNSVMRAVISGEGFMGIGNTNPHAPLQFSNAFTNRKLVLFETGNDDHQYVGFGVNAGVFRYQTGSTSSDHVFFAGTSSSASNELLRIKGNGSIGIANSNPHAPLQFSNDLDNRKLVLFETGDNDHQFVGFGVNTGVFRYQTGSTVSDHVFFAGTSSTTSNELMRIRGNGNVGIGITPVNLLDVHKGAARSNTHPTNRPFYVSGDIGEKSNGIEFRHSNSSQGIGFGFNTIYAAGEGQSQNLGMSAKGPAGWLVFSTLDTARMYVKPTGNVVVNNKIELGYQRVSASSSVAGVSFGEVTCNCPAGTNVMGGGFDYTNIASDNNVHIIDNFPNTDSSWRVRVYNFELVDRTLTVYAICARIN